MVRLWRKLVALLAGVEGRIVDGCMTWEDGSYSIRCAMTVDARAGGGDSGSPVFAITSGNQVQLRGMAFGGTGGCNAGVDPVDPEPNRYCSQFVASNLGGIVMDLDPDGDAPLSFH